MKKMNTEEFINRAKSIHKDTFSYEKTNYVNSKTKVIITCPIHGDFECYPSSFLKPGATCPKCPSRKRIKLTKENFIERASIIHNNKYDYSKIGEIKRVKDIVTIICPEHGEFQQEINSHLQGRGCPICSGKKFDLDNFIKQATKVWNGKYDYSKSEYRGYGKPITIICPEHGEFEQLPNNHLKGECGCLQCRGKPIDFKQIHNIEDLIELSINKFGNKFDFSKSVYINSKTKITIICPEHGEFQTLPYTFIHNQCGCPKCNEFRYARLTKDTQLSSGELLISNILNQFGITYQDQKELIMSEKIRKSNIIVVDFYIEYNNNIYIIEYNGEQHYRYVPFFHKGGEIDFLNQQYRDQALRDYCTNNNIKLLEIPYNEPEKNIESLILNFINYERN